MLQSEIGCFYTKASLIIAIAISITACSPGQDTSSTTPEVSSPSPQPTEEVSSPSPQSTELAASVSIPGVKSLEEINFRTFSKSANGFFDAVNGSTALSNEVSRAAPVKVTGWAIWPQENRLADMVIITHGENNSLVAVAPVNLNRQDIAKFLNNPAYQNSGWSATFDPSSLPTGEVVLKAWAYNSTRKEANSLNQTHTVVLN